MTKKLFYDEEEERGLELGNLLFGHSRGQYELIRNVWDDLFYPLAEKIESLEEDSTFGREGFKTDVFEIFEYQYDACSCRKTHAVDCINIKPNFLYKPINFEIRWYKYPFRDSYANMLISEEQATSMINHCIDSLSKRHDFSPDDDKNSEPC